MIDTEEKYRLTLTENELTLLKEAVRVMKPLIQAPATSRAIRDLYHGLMEKLRKPESYEKPRLITL